MIMTSATPSQKTKVPTQATNFIGLAAASAMGLVYQVPGSGGPGGGSLWMNSSQWCIFDGLMDLDIGT